MSSLRLLRDAGHDTSSVTRTAPGSKDRRVMSEAVRQDRIILTFDKDFSKRVFEDALPPPPGLVQFSMRQPGRREAGERLLALLAGGIRLDGYFTVVTRDSYNQNRLPA